MELFMRFGPNVLLTARFECAQTLDAEHKHRCEKLCLDRNCFACLELNNLLIFFFFFFFALPQWVGCNSYLSQKYWRLWGWALNTIHKRGACAVFAHQHTHTHILALSLTHLIKRSAVSLSQTYCAQMQTPTHSSPFCCVFMPFMRIFSSFLSALNSESGKICLYNKIHAGQPLDLPELCVACILTFALFFRWYLFMKTTWPNVPWSQCETLTHLHWSSPGHRDKQQSIFSPSITQTSERMWVRVGLRVENPK